MEIYLIKLPNSDLYVLRSHAGARTFVESEATVLRATRAGLVAEIKQDEGNNDEL